MLSLPIYRRSLLIAFIASMVLFGQQIYCRAASTHTFDPNDHEENDTAIFKTVKPRPNDLLSFDDNNKLVIPPKKVVLTATAGPDESYTVTVKVRGRSVFSRKAVKGISKVWVNGDHLLFSLFTYEDEDGNNEGYGYLIDLKNNTVKTFPKKLSNTCNPVMVNGNMYFLDGLDLIETDKDLHPRKTVKVVYNASDNKKAYDHLDTYGVESLSAQNNNMLVIKFSPHRSTSAYRSYGGYIGFNTNVVVLR